MDLATEAEEGGIFVSSKNAAILRTTFEELEWKQKNSYTDDHGLFYLKRIHKRHHQAEKSKETTMRFYWINNQETKT